MLTHLLIIADNYAVFIYFNILVLCLLLRCSQDRANSQKRVNNNKQGEGFRTRSKCLHNECYGTFVQSALLNRFPALILKNQSAHSPLNSLLACSQLLGKPSRMKPWFLQGSDISLFFISFSRYCSSRRPDAHSLQVNTG